MAYLSRRPNPRIIAMFSLVRKLASTPQTRITPPENDKAHSLVAWQFRHCGKRYAMRKYLAVLARLRLSAHLEVARALTQPSLLTLVRHHPQAPFKYLRGYLAHSFDLDTRAAILRHHYRYLAAHVGEDFIARACADGIALWRTRILDTHYAISLAYPANEEGELMLSFMRNGEGLFTLAFTLAPAATLEADKGTVMFVGRLQGAAHRREDIKLSSKDFDELVPAALLLTAARGIAAALQLDGIVGVGAHDQICLREARHSKVAAGIYDEFWESNGGKRVGTHYALPVIPVDKPLSEIRNNHRSRVKRKRQTRDDLMQAVAREFRTHCLASPAEHQVRHVGRTCIEADYCGAFAAI